MELFIEKTLFASRWILAPIFLGLALGLIALGIKFFQEAYHLIVLVLEKSESDVVLSVLALIDISLVGSLIVMVMFSGYENFVSTIDTKGTDTLGFGKLDAGTLKLKVAASIVAISSIHLLRIFMQISEKTKLDDGTFVDKYTNDHIMWYVILHMTFVFSALLLGVLDKMSFAKHRDHSPTA
ncbi:MAG TPA: TIGR00645 family protein [Steroidobacteraceae bacterium]|nr:TIGR00645 family protein [Steroidobacteraceae bacterium]